MKAIGPTFAGELSAAGLNGLPFIWSGQGTISFDPSMTQEQVDAVLAVYEAHDPDGVAPVSSPPLLIAAAFGVAVQDGDISNIDGSYNILAGLYLGVGQYMLIFATALPDGYFVSVQGDAASLRDIEKAATYAIVEALDAPGGAPADVSHFDVRCYRI